MAFSGDITDFSLPEIVQVIGYSGRTGRLEINGNIVNLSIVFCNGNPVRITPGHNSVMLGQLLVRGDEIDPAGLNKALTIQEDYIQNGRNKRLGNILLDLGLIDRETLDRYLSLQIRDSFYDILSERKGTFEFMSSADLSDTDDISPINIPDLILNGMREIETRAKIKEVITSNDVVLKKNPKIEVTDIGLLIDEERMVYFAVDGIKSVAEILKSANLAHLNVMEALYRLIKKSYIKVP
jgi:hypothetical protein